MTLKVGIIQGDDLLPPADELRTLDNIERYRCQLHDRSSA